MSQTFRNILFSIFGVLLLMNSSGQTIEVNINRDSILIGEVISMSIQYPISNSTTSLDFIKGDSIGNSFEVFNVVSKDTLDGKTRFQLNVSSFNPGNQFISSLSVYYDTNKVSSQQIPIFVSLVAVDTSKPFKDIHPTYDDPLTSADKWELFWKFIQRVWFIVAFILLMIAAIWFFLFRKKKDKESKAEPEIIIPAHIKANTSLIELKNKNLWQNGLQKEYNVQLTEVIQQYITDRYKVTTKEKTSSEILHSLRFVEMDEQNKTNLRQLLMLSDLVKFAKEKPTDNENNEVLNNAFDFVETTKNDEL